MLCTIYTLINHNEYIQGMKIVIKERIRNILVFECTKPKS